MYIKILLLDFCNQYGGGLATKISLKVIVEFVDKANLIRQQNRH